MSATKTRPGAAKKNKNSPPPKRSATSSRNHKSPDAKARRDALDEKIIGLLSEKKHSEGLPKTDIATTLDADATAVKASLNRLISATPVLVTTTGTTMNTRYKAVPNARTLLKDLRKKKSGKDAPKKAKASQANAD